MEIYLDNAATTKPRPEVVEAVIKTYTSEYGNPSSLHRKGLEAEKLIREARTSVAKLIGALESEIYFTSGGTESNNIAIQGIVQKYARKNKHLITTEIEHHSVLNIFKHLETQGYDVTYLPVDKNCKIDLKKLEEYVREDTALVSIMLVNNEIGSIQNIKEISKIVKSKSAAKIHVDAVQAVGKIPVNVKMLDIDAMSVSGHKLHATKGIGALYLKSGLNINAVYKGSNQESGIKPGTENVPGIVGFGKACEIVANNLEIESSYIRKLRDNMATQLQALLENTIVNTQIEESAPHILSITFKGIRGEVFLHYIENENVYVSTGAACSSKSKGSHVLKAIGLKPDDIDATIRISLSVFNTDKEVEIAIEAMVKTVNEIRKIMKR